MTTYQAEIVGWTATNALRHDLTAHVLALDLPFHHEQSAGELIERVDGDVGTLHRFFAQFVVRIVGNAILLLGLLVILFGQNRLVGLGIGGFVLIVGLLLFRLRYLAVEAIIADRQSAAELTGFWEERLVATVDLRGNGATTYISSSHIPLLWRKLLATRYARFLGWSVHGSYIAIHIAGYALVFGLGAYLYLRGQTSMGTVYLVFHYLGLVVQNLRAFVRELDTLQRARASLSRIQSILRRQSMLTQVSLTSQMETSSYFLEFKGVHFAYGQQSVINDVTFQLRQGERLALLGRTGSGKSTIARLLFRLYDPAAGEIRLNGVKLAALPLAQLRRRVGMVTQRVELFSATVRDNVTFFDPQVEDDAIRQTLQELGLGDWLARLPAGLDSRLSSGGGGLSAGEAQLLALARLFLQDPELIILDEAASRLDPVSETRIATALERLLQGRTAIIIAHRPKTVESTDKVLILEQGRVLEYGDFQILRAKPTSYLNGLFRGMLADE